MHAQRQTIDRLNAVLWGRRFRLPTEPGMQNLLLRVQSLRRESGPPLSLEQSSMQERLARPVLRNRELPTFSPGGNTMHEEHWEAAKLHELAARSHRTAAEHNEKGDHKTALWHSERAMEYSERAYKLAEETSNKSGEILSL